MPNSDPSDRGRLALSVRQPWAELIVSGLKSVEIRSWTDRYRGPLWIHAGLKPAEQAPALLPSWEDLPRGMLVGRVSLDGIVPFDETRWRRWADRHLDPGPVPFGAYGFLLSKPQRLRRPEPLRGQTTLFELPKDLDPDVLAARLEPATTA